MSPGRLEAHNVQGEGGVPFDRSGRRGHKCCAQRFPLQPRMPPTSAPRRKPSGGAWLRAAMTMPVPIPTSVRYALDLVGRRSSSTTNMYAAKTQNAKTDNTVFQCGNAGNRLCAHSERSITAPTTSAIPISVRRGLMTPSVVPLVFLANTQGSWLCPRCAMYSGTPTRWMRGRRGMAFHRKSIRARPL